MASLPLCWIKKHESEANPALKLIHDLWDDVSDPNFVWQVGALLPCLVLASLFANWWRRRHEEGAGRLSDASFRLAFPLTGMVLVGIAMLVLQNFIHVNLFRLALPLLGSMALVRAVVFVLRQAFPTAAWLTTWERIIAPGLGLAGALHHRSGALCDRCAGAG
jgi:hypothetical protein